MSPTYRRPHLGLLRDRKKINAAAGGFVTLSLVLLWKGPARLNQAVGVTLGMIVLVWIWLHNKWTPRPVDVWDYLITMAVEDGQDQWLLGVERGFVELWDLDPKKGFAEVLHNQ